MSTPSCRSRAGSTARDGTNAAPPTPGRPGGCGGRPAGGGGRPAGGGGRPPRRHRRPAGGRPRDGKGERALRRQRLDKLERVLVLQHVEADVHLAKLVVLGEAVPVHHLEQQALRYQILQLAAKLDRLVPVGRERRLLHAALLLLPAHPHLDIRVRLAVEVGRLEPRCPLEVHRQRTLLLHPRRVERRRAHLVEARHLPAAVAAAAVAAVRVGGSGGRGRPRSGRAQPATARGCRLQRAASVLRLHQRVAHPQQRVVLLGRAPPHLGRHRLVARVGEAAQLALGVGERLLRRAELLVQPLRLGRRRLRRRARAAELALQPLRLAPPERRVVALGAQPVGLAARRARLPLGLAQLALEVVGRAARALELGAEPLRLRLAVGRLSLRLAQ